MLSDEEKKAINDLNFIVVTDIYDNEVNIDKTKIINEYNESVGVVLNLIKKQQKEIEELKDKNKFYNTAYNLGKTYSNKKWEDKIKAIIEEIKQRREKDGECELALYGFQREAKIEVLQSLLEKE